MEILSGAGMEKGGSPPPAVDGMTAVTGFRELLGGAGTVVDNPLFGILDLAGDAFVVIDAHSRIVLFNRTAERLFQYEAAEVIGRPVGVLLPERYRGQHGQHMADFRRHG